MAVIQSEQNQWLKKLKALTQKKYRQQYDQFIVEGSRFLAEVLDQQASIEVILVAQGQQMANETLLAQAVVPVMTVQDGLLERALCTVNPQGIAAIVQKPRWSVDDLGQMSRILLVDGVQDPGNLGTIIRTALASGTEAVFCLKGTVDLYNDKVLRATMGAIFKQRVFLVDDHEALLHTLHELGFQVIVADIRGQQYYDQLDFPAKTALVVGNEGNGPQLIQAGDAYVKIPLHGGAESLNVAIATGILLYELERQKNRQSVQEVKE